MRRKLSLLMLCAVLLLSLPQPSARALGSAEDLIRIGLYYGDEALPSANLQNVTGAGAGYQVGWFDGNDIFNHLGFLPEVYLTMTPDTSCQVQLDQQFFSYDEARLIADQYGTDAFVAYDGGFRVRIGNFSSYYDAADYAAMYGGYAIESSLSGYTIRETNTGEFLFEFDLGGASLAVRPVIDLFVENEGAETWFKGRKYYGSFEYTRSGSVLTVANVVSMEDYVRGVVPYEMSPSWPLEALKTQAVCARTYAYANLHKHSRQGFDLCNTTECQVYFGTNAASELTDRAVAETAGQVITYDGELIDAVFYASNGGASEDSENVWYNALPYLRAVRDDFEALTNTAYTDWSYELTLSDITNILRDRGNSISGSIVHAYATYTDAGNMSCLTFLDASGKKFEYEGERARSVFNVDGYRINVRSQRFIFEDKHHMRIQSNAEITNVSAGSGAAPGGAQYGTALVAASRVLTAGGLQMGGIRYPASAPILTADGIENAEIVTTISGASGFSANTVPTEPGRISAASLKIPASCSGTFVIRGSGNGHNVGLSQYGAKAMAEQGYTYQQIIPYYYTGVLIDTMQ